MGKKSLQTFNLPENIIMMSKEDFMMNYMTYDEDEDEYYFKKLDGKDLVYICQGSVGGDWVKEQLENEPISDRIDPELLDPFKSNPYTQSLSSYAY